MTDCTKARVLSFAGIMGVWGVLTGFAVFLYVHRKTEHGVRVFVAGLLLAAFAAFIVETIREKIYRTGSQHGREPITAARFLNTIVLLAAIELVIASWEQLAELFAHFQRARSALIEATLLDSVGSLSSLTLQLVVYGGFWVTIGAAVSMAIAHSSLGLSRPGMPLGSRARQSFSRGLIAAALLTVTYLVGTRVLITLWVLLTNPECYRPGFDPDAFSGPVAIIFVIAAIIESIAHWRPFGWPAGGALAVALIAGSAIVAVRATGWGRNIAGCVFVLCLLNTFLTDDIQFGRLAGAIIGTTMVWFVPIAVLSAGGPFLSRGGIEPRYWGFVCFAAAGLLIV